MFFGSLFGILSQSPQQGISFASSNLGLGLHDNITSTGSSFSSWNRPNKAFSPLGHRASTNICGFRMSGSGVFMRGAARQLRGRVQRTSGFGNNSFPNAQRGGLSTTGLKCREHCSFNSVAGSAFSGDSKGLGKLRIGFAFHFLSQAPVTQAHLGRVPETGARRSFRVPTEELKGGMLCGKWNQTQTARGFFKLRVPRTSEGSVELETASGEEGEQDPTIPQPQDQNLPLKIRSGVMSIPGPDKPNGGEDSFFITDHDWVGVADGVGGWAEVGVDAGEYARTLMTYSKDESIKQQNDQDPLSVLDAAFHRTDVEGSSTACVLAVVNGYIRAANVGDSGFVLVREGRVLFRSPPQQHNFNFPFQLGVESSDTPGDAQCYMIPVRSGDIIVSGTDGLFDNVFDHEVASVAYRARNLGHDPDKAAERMANLAQLQSRNENLDSPFAQAAKQWGFAYKGGKPDDITVVVSYID